jgi:hypothetical protein
MTDTYDLIVCGAGAGGMTAAVVAAAEGLRVLLLEKTGLVGGTTAWSGGLVWAPANWLTAAIGQPDTPDAARRYLQQMVPDGFNAAPREAFVTRANEAVTWLATHTPVQFMPVVRYPDYYPDQPGATDGGRVMEPCPFDASLLGSRFDLLRPPLPEFMLFGGMMVSRPDLTHFRRIGRSSHATWRVLSLLTRYAWQRKHAARGTTLYLGNALAGRLLLALGQHHVTLRTNAPVARLLQEGSRVCGVLLWRTGR